LEVELHRQELHPYVVIILKSGKAHPVGLIDLDHTKAEISKDDSKRFTLSTDSTNTDKNKTIDFVTKTDERANYWADVFNQKLHFEVKLISKHILGKHTPVFSTNHQRVICLH